jgi:hypothetical protein
MQIQDPNANLPLNQLFVWWSCRIVSARARMKQNKPHRGKTRVVCSPYVCLPRVDDRSSRRVGDIHTTMFGDFAVRSRIRTICHSRPFLARLYDESPQQAQIEFDRVSRMMVLYSESSQIGLLWFLLYCLVTNIGYLHYSLELSRKLLRVSCKFQMS